MLRMICFVAAITLLFSLALIPSRAAMANEDRCADASRFAIFPLGQCQWQQLSPRPGDEHVCDIEPLNLVGTDGPDQLYGDDLDDVLIGKRGKDRLDGGKGNDVLHGGRGDDVLIGAMGADELHGGRGDDTYTGGRDSYEYGDLASDRFVFSPKNKGDKIITDFDPCFSSRDWIVLAGQGWPSVADILASEVEESGGFFVYRLRRGLTVETDVPLETGDFLLE